MGATVAVFGTERGAGVSRLLTELRIGHDLLPIAELATADLGRYEAVVVLADDYPTPTHLDVTRLEAYVAAGHHAYVEYATADTFLPKTGEPETAGYERIVLVESGALLEEHQSRYLPVDVPRGATVPLVYAKVAGVYTAVFGLPEQTAPALLHLPHQAGVLTYATTALSNFERGRYSLQSSWRALWRDLLAGLLPGLLTGPPDDLPLEAWTVPRVWADPADPVRLVVATRPGVAVDAGVPMTEKEPGRYESDDLELEPGDHTFTVTAGDRTAATATISIQPRADRYRAMVDRAFAWFERAGMLFEAGDGSQGVAEGLSSELPPDGRHSRRDQLRGDCFVECAYAYRLYARLTGNARYETIARNLMDLVLDRMQITSRSALYGSWDTRGYGKDKPPEELDYLFSDDEGWISLGALVFAEDDDRALRQGLRGTEALLRTANNGLQAEFQRREPVRLAKQGWKNVAALDIPDPIDVTPHWQSMPQTAYLYAYGRTGAQRYLDAATRGLDHMIAQYPKIGVETSRTTAISRYLLPLAGAYEYVRAEEYKEILHKLADELEAWQDDETGAIREWDGFNPASNDAYGTTENSIFQTNGEPLADQLYSTGFLAMNLHLAFKATGDGRFREIQERLLDFLARIQIESDDVQLDATWMRSFDFQRWEYHGSSADIGWGPFCVETGWMVAPIVIGALYYLTDGTFFPEPRANQATANAIVAEFDALERELGHDGPTT